jgi:arginyl-tRNA synthetase
MDALTTINQDKRAAIEAYRDICAARHQKRVSPEFSRYPLQELERRISLALSDYWGHGDIGLQLEPILRSKFGGDISIKFPQLLKLGGPKGFVRDHLPWIAKTLSGLEFQNEISRIDMVGMYINLTLTDEWLLQSTRVTCDLGATFGQSDRAKDQVIVVDYSSPNVAKVLHAGHIRSTIAGHVLANLYEATGALVYRINHINDFGGFGYLLEGYTRFYDHFGENLSNDQKLLEVYGLRRLGERLLANRNETLELSIDDSRMLRQYFPHTSSLSKISQEFAQFEIASQERGRALEQGEPRDVELWSQMVGWSLKTFQPFYDALSIHFDLVIGESFYVQSGNKIVADGMRSGTIVTYDDNMAEHDRRDVQQQLMSNRISREEHDSLQESIRKDIGAAVVRVSAAERYVVQRADGMSIYLTRDLGAISLRMEIFAPTHVVYVVGQEQIDHFQQLFHAAHLLRIVTNGDPSLLHVHFGFYVDSLTSKKLSSRQSVSNVMLLLETSVAHFRAKLSKRGRNTSGEGEEAARQLSLGALVFNDLKQDIRGSVAIDASDPHTTIMDFEKSGGPYVVYAACRARSILRKQEIDPRPVIALPDFALEDQEVELIMKLQQLPQKISAAAGESNPAILIRHLLDLAKTYNSYYTRVPVLLANGVVEARLMLTKAFYLAVKGALSVCHIECPDAI